MVMERRTGVLMPLFSLRRAGDAGIGDLAALEEWIDWAAEFGVGFLQLLPVNALGEEDAPSPYSAISSVALEPLYLTLERIPGMPAERPAYPENLPPLQLPGGRDLVDYARVRSYKRYWFTRAWRNFEQDAAYAPLRQEFETWVFDTVLPALRRTGAYIAGEERMDEDELIAQGYLALQRKLAARTAELGRANEVIAELAPKAAYYDAVAGSEGDKSFRETAKTFGVPEKKFIAFLIDHGYVYRDARGTLTPYADHMKRGQFTVREIVYNGAEMIRTSSQTKITPKGRQVIWRAMEKDGLITL